MDNTGYIYKIINIINNKVYIGQTKQSIEQRFCQHKSHARNNRNNHKLGNAIRKYGDENFIIEKIEECNYNDLNDRERYWIKKYNSIENGYNSTLGGQDISIYYEIDNQKEIIDYYQQCHNQQETIKKFNITEYKFRQMLLKNNIPTDYTNYGIQKRKKIIIVELNKIFESEVDCAKFLIQEQYTKAKINCVKVGIAKSVSKNTSYLGLSFRDYEQFLSGDIKINVKKKKPTKEELENQILTQSVAQLAKVHQVHETTIRNWLKKYDIKIPSRK